jgi:hypothetical protein
VLLVTDFLFGDVVAGFTTGAVVVLIALVWYAIPLRRRFAP